MRVLQGILSDGRTLLLAVAPAASPGVKSAAAAAMAAGAAAALQASGMATSVHSKAEMLPWQAFHAMAYMVRALNVVKALFASIGMHIRLYLLTTRTAVHVWISVAMCFTRRHWKQSAVQHLRHSCWLTMRCCQPGGLLPPHCGCARRSCSAQLHCDAGLCSQSHGSTCSLGPSA
jgi:hypothetical protein